MSNIYFGVQLCSLNDVQLSNTKEELRVFIIECTVCRDVRDDRNFPQKTHFDYNDVAP